MQFAAHQARLNAPYSNGETMRDIKERIVALGPGRSRAKLYANAVKILAGPPMPDQMRRLWGWFNELRATQRVGMAGVEPISYGDIRDWADLTAREPEPFHVQVIVALDHTIRRESAPKKDNAPTSEEPAISIDRGNTGNSGKRRKRG